MYESCRFTAFCASCPLSAGHKIQADMNPEVRLEAGASALVSRLTLLVACRQQLLWSLCSGSSSRHKSTSPHRVKQGHFNKQSQLNLSLKKTEPASSGLSWLHSHRRRIMKKSRPENH